MVGVLVAGNQTIVEVGVSLEERVGVMVGMEFGPEQAARNSPVAARNRVKIRCARKVSFIVLKI